MVEKEKSIENQNNLTISYFNLFNIHLPDYSLNSVTLGTRKSVIKLQHFNETYIWRNENVALNDFKDSSQLTIILTYITKTERALNNIGNSNMIF
jgi:hypothetical protein